MTKIERRVAYYSDGSTVEGKTARKKFDNNGLVAVVTLFHDGTRELEPISPVANRKQAVGDIGTRIAFLMAEARLEYKSDGGTTPEIQDLIRKKNAS